MKTLSAFSFLPSSGGFGLTAKIIAAVLVLAGGAGGVLYSLSEKNYAPQTIEFDGRTFYLIGATDKMYAGEKEGVLGYAAPYTDARPALWTEDSQWHLKDAQLHFQIWYAANPAPEWVQDGAFSPVAYFAVLGEGEEKRTHPRSVFDEIRARNGEEFRAFAWDTYPDISRLRASVRRCGAARANAFICVRYMTSEKYEKTAREWMNAKGESHLERMYDLLEDYPLSYDEELLSDMAAAAE